MKKSLTDKQRKWLGIGLIVFAVLFCVGIAWLVGKPLIEHFGEPEKFKAWVDEQGIWGRAAFCGIVLVQVIVALIPGEPFEFAAGYAFGVWEGTALCMLSILVGSLLIFLLVRRFGKPLVNLFFPNKQLDDLKFLNSDAKLDTWAFILMLIPGTPKDLLSYIVGLTKMKLGAWLLIVLLARIPSIVTSTISGSALGEKNYVAAIIVYGATAVVSIAGGLIYKRILCKKQDKADATD